MIIYNYDHVDHSKGKGGCEVAFLASVILKINACNTIIEKAWVKVVVATRFSFLNCFLIKALPGSLPAGGS